MNDYPEGTTSTCVHCGSAILLDQREGGGPGKDWGASPADWVGHGGIGMDYGCGDNPDSDEEGTAGHEPDPSSIQVRDHQRGNGAFVSMDYHQFLLAFVNNEKPQSWRRGQYAFNLLHSMKPKLAELVRATPIDPFHRDERIPAFLEFVQAHWEDV